MEIYITLYHRFFLQIVQRNDKLLANNNFEQLFQILGFLTLVLRIFTCSSIKVILD